MIENSKEVVVASATAASNSAFNRLGLTDAALFEAVTDETPLLTVDIDLYLQVLSKGENTPRSTLHLFRTCTSRIS